MMKKKMTPAPKSPSMSPSRGSYTKQDSINYVRGTERMARAATEMKKTTNPNTKQYANMDFRKAQAEVANNAYYKSSVKGTANRPSAKKVTVTRKK